MKMIAVEALLSIAKDVTLANGAKHRCIDATQIWELPKTEIVLCKDCLYRSNTGISTQWLPCMDNTSYPDDFYCGRGERKDGDGDG